MPQQPFIPVAGAEAEAPSMSLPGSETVSPPSGSRITEPLPRRVPPRHHVGKYRCIEPALRLQFTLTAANDDFA